MKRFYVVLMRSMAVVTTWAVPAKRSSISATIGGKNVVLTYMGDEFAHYYLDEDSQKMYQKVDGEFVEFTAEQLQEAVNQRS